VLILWKELSKFHRDHARKKRRDNIVFLFAPLQSQHSVVQKRLSQTEMDRLLRQERERTLTGQSDTKTFAFLKPEALQQHIAGNVLSRIERKGFTVKQLRLHNISRKEAETLYAVHKGKPFFQELVDHVTSGPVVLMILEGPNAVETLRRVIGATNPQNAEPGTIRGDLSLSITANVIHASDSIENARKESSIFFPKEI